MLKRLNVLLVVSCHMARPSKGTYVSFYCIQNFFAFTKFIQKADHSWVNFEFAYIIFSFVNNRKYYSQKSWGRVRMCMTPRKKSIFWQTKNFRVAIPK